jgi:hypothetical protein
MRVKLNGNDFYEVTSPFGSIDSVHHTAHTGLDLAMGIGTHLNSPVNGVVKNIVDYGSNNIGKGIYIETDSHQTVIMGHLSDIKTHVGARVREGDFVALSGSTGHSTGGHLHLGLKDAGGHFVNPQSLTNETTQHSTNIIEDFRSFTNFTSDVKSNGLFHAIYGKSFFEVCEGFFSELFHDIGIAILSNSELIFVVPSIVFMFGTWITGRNKFTKWIIPLWIGYLLSKFIYYTIGGN